MGKRVFDIVAAVVIGGLAAPLIAVASALIKLTDPGPVLYRATRAGRHGHPFEILKLRTMRVQDSPTSQITAHGDQRVFPVGAFLRKTKVDELPQLWNILVGDMSVVGPRPEDMSVVVDHYRPEHLRTLDVRPGLASPGSIYNYTHGERLIGSEDPELDYLQKLLPIKLGLELAYVENASFRYDLALIKRTIAAIGASLTGRVVDTDPPEMEQASTDYFHPIEI